MTKPTRQKHQASDDKAYRDLFSYREITRELITEFLPSEIAQRLDTSTLVLKNGQYITPLNNEKIQDLVWSAQLFPESPNEPPQQIYVHLLLEFQSSVDKTMSLRMAFYTMSFYQHLIKHEEINLTKEKLPLVFPVVLYNGDSKWSIPNRMAALCPPMPSFLKKYQIQQHYYLIDEQRLNKQQLKSSDSFLSSIFNIEQVKTTQGLELILATLQQKIKALPQEQALRHVRFLSNWINNYLLKSRLEFKLSEHSLLEDEAVSLRNYVMKQREKDIEVGIEQGKQEGRQEGVAGVLVKLIKLKFGDVPAWAQQRLEQATLGQLEQWTGAILSAENLEDLLA